MGKKEQPELDDTAVDVEALPGTTYEVKREYGSVKISVGIKNSLSVNAAPDGRWASIAPYISITKSYEKEPENLLGEVMELHQKILPAYGYLLLQENARVLAIQEGRRTLVEACMDMLGVQDD